MIKNTTKMKAMIIIQGNTEALHIISVTQDAKYPKELQQSCIMDQPMVIILLSKQNQLKDLKEESLSAQNKTLEGITFSVSIEKSRIK